ncbi:hypothetical protein JTE90_020559 [Oedothorax gibbosus]|uniref:Uncharacterized protein n=1 Tax=Oedothorax gibbosus TaxID=931172 RepID=A0AAV6VYZ1_9ARAC|nr:hypothetical protein JTE90_020559 [Oedothorax gibbosus]
MPEPTFLFFLVLEKFDKRDPRCFSCNPSHEVQHPCSPSSFFDIIIFRICVSRLASSVTRARSLSVLPLIVLQIPATLLNAPFWIKDRLFFSLQASLPPPATKERKDLASLSLIELD